MSRVLVVANETVGADELLAELRKIEGGKQSQFYVVVPARPLHERHGRVWTQSGAIEAAQSRLATTLGILEREGLDATGGIGDLEPISAIADALMDFDADTIVISTHPEARSRWLRTGLVEQTRRKFGKPVVHVVSNVLQAPGQ